MNTIAAVPHPSHRCRRCRNAYTPTYDESEDCPVCGFDGTDGYVPVRTTMNPDLLHRLVQPVSSASGLLHNTLDGVYGDLTANQQEHLRQALMAMGTALESIRKASKA